LQLFCAFVCSNKQKTHLEHGVASKSRDRSWDVGSSAERHDGDHSKTAVVELGILLLLECLGGDVGEVNRRENDSGQISALGVMRALDLCDDLGKEDGEVDLRAAGLGHGGPGVEGLHGRKVGEGDALGGGEHSWEVPSGGLDEVAGGGEHGAAGVLELGGAEPGEGLLGS